MNSDWFTKVEPLRSLCLIAHYSKFVLGAIKRGDIICNTTDIKTQVNRARIARVGRTYVMTNFSLDCWRRIFVSPMTSEILGVA